MMTVAQPAAMATVPPPKNGNGEKLPEHRQKIVEAANAAYQQVLAERDEIDRKLHEATLKIEGMTVQLDALKGVINMMESTYLSTKLELENRAREHQVERDAAVTRTAGLETTLLNVMSVIRSSVAEPEAQ